MKKITLLISLFIVSISFAANKNATLKIAADAVPHTELLEFVAPDLKKQGVDLKIYTNTDSTLSNTQTATNELDANFFQHYPYLESQIRERKLDLVNAGNIHVEPIGVYSDKHKRIEDLPKNAKIAILNDTTNEYRVLRILEQNGFVKLKKTISPFTASIRDIETYLKPVQIVELDAALIIRVRDQFDAYSTNTNKVLEAGIDINSRLFAEGGDSPYANIVVVNSKRVNDPAIITLVAALRSEKTRDYIRKKYKGAVIPAK
ncbi:MAG: methionine ABC transporter substrate-binding protein [Elusimicrobiota bacterium]|jgi:D-methionine transport system substrate-binding protein|nr:methionine ABC transporter substrate-binding protein [Elusimicrobiota bacterium]